MSKLDLAARLQEKLNSRETKEVVNVNTFIQKEHFKYDYLNNLLSNIEENETKDFLKNESFKLINIQAKSSLELGEIFTNVFNKLSKQGSSDGLYENWLELHGYNKKTALRHRKRFEFYKEVNENKKSIVALLPVRIIEELYKDKETSIDLINMAESPESLISLNVLENKEPLSVPKEIYYDFNIFNNFQERITSLKDKDKEKVEKLLSEIYKILTK